MEKFALLNLLKAIDGLNKAEKGNDGGKPAEEAAQKPKPAENIYGDGGLPNFMAEQLLRHEVMSNRLKNKK